MDKQVPKHLFFKIIAQLQFTVQNTKQAWHLFCFQELLQDIHSRSFGNQKYIHMREANISVGSKSVFAASQAHFLNGSSRK